MTQYDLRIFSDFTVLLLKLRVSAHIAVCFILCYNSENLKADEERENDEKRTENDDRF